MSWGALIAHLVEHKCEHTNNIKHVYVWAINNNAIYKVLRDKRSNANTRYVWGSNHCSTSLPSHRRIFTMYIQDLSKRDLHRGITTYTLGVHNSNSLSHLCTRGRHKAKHKAKRKYNLMITRISNNSSWCKKISNKFSHKTRSYRIDFELKSSSMWVKQSFWKRKHKENYWEKLLDR